ncbi:MAG: hypothetical protein Q4B70_01795 [Lachnospiraceae bacterium]|nr:hypothetical protein [Lachnospiraceae bacterium]
MVSKVEEAKAIYREKLDKECELVITKKGWYIQFHANTWDEGKDMNYKVTSEKLPQFLSDLKKNLKLYLNMKEENEKIPRDAEGLREMILRFKGEESGVYLSDTYRIMTCQEDYDLVEELVKKARDRVHKVLETM